MQSPFISSQKVIHQAYLAGTEIPNIHKDLTLHHERHVENSGHYTDEFRIATTLTGQSYDDPTFDLWVSAFRGQGSKEWSYGHFFLKVHGEPIQKPKLWQKKRSILDYSHKPWLITNSDKLTTVQRYVTAAFHQMLQDLHSQLNIQHYRQQELEKIPPQENPPALLAGLAITCRY